MTSGRNNAFDIMSQSPLLCARSNSNAQTNPDEHSFRKRTHREVDTSSSDDELSIQEFHMRRQFHQQNQGVDSPRQMPDNVTVPLPAVSSRKRSFSPDTLSSTPDDKNGQISVSSAPGTTFPDLKRTRLMSSLSALSIQNHSQPSQFSSHSSNIHSSYTNNHYSAITALWHMNQLLHNLHIERCQRRNHEGLKQPVLSLGSIPQGDQEGRNLSHNSNSGTTMMDVQDEDDENEMVEIANSSLKYPVRSPSP